MTNRVLIIEDNHLLRRGLRAMINNLPGFEVVAEGVDGKEGIREALSCRPDVVLLDISMPGMSGIDATAQLKRRLPAVRIILLTIHHTAEYVLEAWRAGADGYVLKDMSYEEFVVAINTVAAGKKFICQDVSVHMAENLLEPRTEPTPVSPWEKLTSRERSILKLIAEGRTNRGTGEFLCISEKTVEKHRANLMRKLGLRNTAEVMLAAIDMGLIERPAIRPLRSNGLVTAVPDIPGFTAFGTGSLAAH